MRNPDKVNIDQVSRQRRDMLLVQAVLHGDSRSFAELVRLHMRRLLLLGKSFFKNEADAEDFVQDVFLKVYTKLPSFRGDSLFSTWITRIAYNTAINSVNRRKQYEPIMDEAAVPDNWLTPEQLEMRRLTIEAVREALTELPERYAVCLDLYFFYDLPYSTISEMTDLPVNTIKSHIFRAKKILRDKLADYYMRD